MLHGKRPSINQISFALAHFVPLVNYLTFVEITLDSLTLA